MHRRRRPRIFAKKSSTGIRTVEVNRGTNGFGFTISGQKPCILSCIVTNSPAELSGLRAGDFLISVNGMNVSKYPHEDVVNLIGNATGVIKMAISSEISSEKYSNLGKVAENYYSDSSDDDVMFHQQKTLITGNRFRPRYHRTKLNRVSDKSTRIQENIPENALLMDIPTTSTKSYNVIHSPNAPGNVDISNVSAMIPSRYRVIVGYLGTIEMPEQMANSSVTTCIRKMRQEKRNPTKVLMTILPSCLNLKNMNNVVIATYHPARLVSSSSENDNKYFALVTSGYSGLYADVVISNSCHIFMVDTKLVEHSIHIEKADLFKIKCTKDPISDICLEFPINSDYVVNLIRSMYSLKSSIRQQPSVVRNLNMDIAMRLNPALEDAHDFLVANSPQPSNHSEITTSSNSDSGIGFHNDCQNISDRILVVDFPGIQNNHIGNIRANLNNRPVGIINDVNENPIRNIGNVLEEQSENRLAVRAVNNKVIDMPDKMECPKYDTVYPNINYHKDAGHVFEERPIDVPKSDFSIQAKKLYDPKNQLLPSSSNTAGKYSRTNRLEISASCDDVINLCKSEKQNLQFSVDDISQVNYSGVNRSNNHHIFLEPKPVKKNKKPCSQKNKQSDCNSEYSSAKSCSGSDQIVFYKFSPKTKLKSHKPEKGNFSASAIYSGYTNSALARPISMSVENLVTEKKKKRDKEKLENFSFWGSLQDLKFSHEIEKSNYVEGIYSEPDLRFDEVKQIHNETSPFRRWGQSSLRVRPDNHCSTVPRRPASLVGSENDVYTKSMEDEFSAVKNLNTLSAQTTASRDVIKMPIGPVSWGTSFERLLEDPAGLCAFSEFLRKEFATENIYFWTACERYRQIHNDQERSKEAQEIFAKHMGIGALEPVNVDSKARTHAQDNLPTADPDIFAAAQKQIFNLMKFDSYQRFIKSDLYKSCLEAEAKNQPIPFSADQLDPSLRTSTIPNPTSSKLKKSLSNAEDRRRKSLLPWHRKTRCKSKDRSDDATNRKDISNIKSSTLKLPSENSASDVHSSRSSLSSIHYDPDDNRNLLCRVILSNGALTHKSGVLENALTLKSGVLENAFTLRMLAQTRSNETIRELVERLLEKRGIAYTAYEVFLNGSTKPLDINGPSTCLAGKEVLIEQRVVFKLDLPNRKVISVKSKATKGLGDVLRPILHKYNYELDFVQTFVKDNTDPLDMGLSVTYVDGHRLLIVCRDDEIEFARPPLPIIASSQHQQIINHFQIQAINVNNKANNQQQNTLDEITNKVFNELLQGKVDSSSTAQGGTNLTSKESDHGSVKSEDYGSETSSGMFGRLRRRDSSIPSRKAKNANNASDDGIKKPLIAKWKAGVKLQVTTRTQKNDELLEGLTRAQRRLEDQRGTEINFELPDFLKNKENFTSQNAKLRTPVKRSDFLSNEYAQTQSREKEYEKPQPAPRLSITNQRDADLSNLSMKCLSSPVKSDENEYTDSDHAPLNNSFNSSMSIQSNEENQKAPPPLPPKPRIVPIKPSNWNSKPYLSNTSSFV